MAPRSRPNSWTVTETTLRHLSHVSRIIMRARRAGGAHRGWQDPRNLWPELFRCVRETRPRAVLAENVRGLLRATFQPYYSYILRELAHPFERRVAGEDWRDHDRRLAKAASAAGGGGGETERYDVFCLPVNAADYGVPQVRRRVFVVAFRRDLGLADWQPPSPLRSRAGRRAGGRLLLAPTRPVPRPREC